VSRQPDDQSCLCYVPETVGDGTTCAGRQLNAAPADWGLLADSRTPLLPFAVAPLAAHARARLSFDHALTERRSATLARTPRKWQGARTPSGLKRVRQAERRRAILQPRRSAAKTLVAKAVSVATTQPEGDDVAATLAEAISALDRAAKAGAIHPNAAARRKSRMVRKVNAAVVGTQIVAGHVTKSTGKAAAAKAAKARIAAGKASKAKGAQTAAGKARAALSRSTRAEAAPAAAPTAAVEAKPAAKTTRAAAAKSTAAKSTAAKSTAAKSAGTKTTAAKATATKTTAAKSTAKAPATKPATAKAAPKTATAKAAPKTTRAKKAE
jgi:ribosomal protein S20